MHATVSRYEGFDAGRAKGFTKKVDENLIPRLSERPGSDGYHLIATTLNPLRLISGETPRPSVPAERAP